MKRGNVTWRNVIQGKRDSRKNIFREMCFQGDGPRGNVISTFEQSEQNRITSNFPK
jgi:hypothetical protein